MRISITGPLTVPSEHRQSRTTGTCIRAPQHRHPCACSAAAPCVWQGRALTQPSEISIQRNAGTKDARRHAAAARQRSARAPPSTRARSGGTRSPRARRCPATAARPCAAPRAPPACGRRSARSPPRRAPSLRARHRAASRCEGRFRVREPTQHMWYAAPGTEPARAAFARHRGARRTPCNPLPPATRWRSALLGQCRTRSTGTCPALANEATGRIRAMVCATLLTADHAHGARSERAQRSNLNAINMIRLFHWQQILGCSGRARTAAELGGGGGGAHDAPVRARAVHRPGQRARLQRVRAAVHRLPARPGPSELPVRRWDLQRGRLPCPPYFTLFII